MAKVGGNWHNESSLFCGSSAQRETYFF